MKNIILVILVLIFILLFYTMLNIRYETKRSKFLFYPSLNLNFNNKQHLYDSFETGDVIFYSHEHKGLFSKILYNLTSQFLTHTIYSHVGIIVKVNGIPYVYGSFRDPTKDIYTNTYKKGPCLENIESLQKYDGFATIMKCKKRINLNKTLFNKILKQNYNKLYSVPYNVLFSTLKPALIKPPFNYDEKFTYCSQFVVKIMNELGIYFPFPYKKFVVTVKDVSEFCKNSSLYSNKSEVINNDYYYEYSEKL